MVHLRPCIYCGLGKTATPQQFPHSQTLCGLDSVSQWPETHFGPSVPVGSGLNTRWPNTEAAAKTGIHLATDGCDVPRTRITPQGNSRAQI